MILNAVFNFTQLALMVYAVAEQSCYRIWCDNILIIYTYVVQNCLYRADSDEYCG